jgi:replicative DNA helicase
VLLGTMMSTPAAVGPAREFVGPQHMYEAAHIEIFQAIESAYAAGEPTGPVAIVHRLDTAGVLERIGGAPYVHTVFAAATAAASVTYYARIVRAAADQRTLAEFAIRLTQLSEIDDAGRRGELLPALVCELTALGQQAVGRTDSRLVNGAAFVLDTPQDVPAVWGDDGQVLWAQGEALMLCGPSGVGKTTLAGQLVAARLGLIDKVLGMPVAPGRRRVLYLAGDRPSQAARSLRRTLRPEWRDTIADRLVVWKGPPPADFAKSPGTMLAMAREADADTVVVDSVKDVALGVSDDAVGAGYNRARQEALVAGVEVLELHHQVKRSQSGGPPTALADVYGSVWLTAGAGSVVLLWGEAGDPVVRLTHLKQPASEFGPLDVLHDHKTGLSTVHRHTDLVRVAALAAAGLTVPDAARLMFETPTPTKAQREKARRQLDKLHDMGRLARFKGRAGGADGSSPDTYHATTNDTEHPR